MQRKWRRAWLRGKPHYMRNQPVRKARTGSIKSKVYSLTAKAAKKLVPAATAAGIFLSSLTGVQANPAGGSIAAGTGSITGQGTSNVTINQTSDKLAINWNSFNIGSGEKVQFIQPGASSIALNRVLGSNASGIYGQLSANGKVFLINPNGVLFAKGAQVNVGGLVASTLNLSDKDFMNGKYTFSGDSGQGVLNQGNITAANGGYVALLGTNAANEGVILAKEGTVALGAGSKVALDFTGDGLLTLSVDESKVKAEVKNSGLIKADGGLVVMNAKAADALTGSVVNNTGTIEAKSVTSKNGAIILTGDTVTNAGTLDASGKGKGQNGGTVKMLGDTVKLASGSSVDVSGDTGGTTLIGGAYQGGNSEYAATKTVVEQGAKINADALTSGNGGQVVVWANDTTNFAGSISAKGGKEGGDGGSVETSGKKTLTVADSASVNTTAAKGKTGNWLLDPGDFTVGTGATGANYWNNEALSTALGSTDITITTALNQNKAGSNTYDTTGDTGNGDINILAPVSWSANKLTLSAYRNINIKNTLSATGTAALDMTSGTGGSGSIDYGLTASGFTGKVNFDRSGNGFLRINNQDYTVITSLGAQGSTTGTDLQGMSNNLSGKYFLGANIDASSTSSWNSGAGFTPIGNGPTPFKGTFDGGGHTVSDLVIKRSTIDVSGSYTGLFGYISGATLSNIGLVNASVRGYNSVGSLAGSVDGNSSISGSYATGSVSGNGNVGGLAGSVSVDGNSSISGSYATVNVSGKANSGGLLGQLELNGGSISGSYATGSVNATEDFIGGLVGYVGSNNRINNSYATGIVKGRSTVGGLAGNLKKSSSISNSYATGSVTGISGGVGGLVGSSNGTISSSYATGSVTGDRYVGGLVGYNCAKSSSIGSISSSYATGSVNGTSNVGGLVGYNSDNSISSSYATGGVTGTGSNVGGLVGENYNGSGTITDSYWNTETSGQATSDGGTGKTTAELMAGLPTGFASSTWGIINGTSYPYLLWRYPTTPQVVSGTVSGTTVPGQTVQAAANGSLIGSTTTGKNGFYYLLFDNNTIKDNTSLLTYLDNGSATRSAVYRVSMNTSNTSLTGLTLDSGLNVYGGSSTAELDVNNLMTTAIGSLTDTDILYTSTGGSISATGGLSVVAPSSALTVSNALTASGDILLKAKDALTLAATGSVTSTGGNVTLVSTNGQFINNNTAVNALSGRRWLVYSATPNIAQRGNLDYSFSQYGKTYGDSTALAAGGNGFIYSSALTLSAALKDTVNKTYDGKTDVKVQAGNLSLNANDLTGATAAYTGTGISASYDNKNVTGATKVTVTDTSAAAADISAHSTLLDGNNKSVYGYTTSLTNDSTNGTITAKALKAVQDTAVTKTYDGKTKAGFDGNNIHLTGVVENETVTVSGTGTYATKDHGSRAVTVNSVTLGGAGAAEGNYTLAASDVGTNGTLNGVINQKALKAVQDTAVTKTYDGKTKVGFDGNNIHLTGVVENETVTVSGTGTYATKDHGSRAVTVNSVTLGGAGAAEGNYTLAASDVGTNGTLNGVINQRVLTVAATVEDKVYDGNTSAKVTGVIFGNLVGSETLTADYTSGTFNDKHVGDNKAVTVSGLTMTEGANTLADNYLLPTTVTSNASITPAALTINAVTNTKTYDGTNIANATPAYNSNDVKTGDKLTVSETYDNKNAGTDKILTVSYVMDDGNGGKNYNVTTKTATGTINKAALTVTANDDAKIYDKNAYTGGNKVTYEGFVNGENKDVLGGSLTYGGTSQGATEVGSYTITPAGLTAANYTITFKDGTLTIKPAAITHPGYIAAVQNAQQAAYPPAANAESQQMPDGQVSPIQYSSDTTETPRVITTAGQTVTIAQDSPVQLATNPVQREIAIYQTVNGSTVLAGAYHVDSSQGSLALRESDASFAPVSPEVPASAYAQAETSSFQLTDSQGNTANFTIAYTGGSLYVQVTNAAAADMLSQNRQLITAAALVAAQDKLSIDIKDLLAVVYLEK